MYSNNLPLPKDIIDNDLAEKISYTPTPGDYIRNRCIKCAQNNSQNHPSTARLFGTKLHYLAYNEWMETFTRNIPYMAKSSCNFRLHTISD